MIKNIKENLTFGELLLFIPFLVCLIVVISSGGLIGLLIYIGVLIVFYIILFLYTHSEEKVFTSKGENNGN